MATTADVYYDPYDFDIDANPYPIWERLRDERPLYYNERYDFWAISRFHDVENLLCADSSVFPTSTGYGPTLTIVATALRAATLLCGGDPPPAAV